jgi:DNA-binding response OmpR family regulator
MNDRQPTTTVCVIDDDELVRQLIVKFLSARGFSVLEAEDGEAGMKIIEHNSPSLVITDIMMPNREGIETIREAKRRFPAIPILVMSGSSIGGRANFLDFAHKLGADAFIAKPFDRDTFLERVDELLVRNGDATSVD